MRSECPASATKIVPSGAATIPKGSENCALVPIPSSVPATPLPASTATVACQFCSSGGVAAGCSCCHTYPAAAANGTSTMTTTPRTTRTTAIVYDAIRKDSGIGNEDSVLSQDQGIRSWGLALVETVLGEELGEQVSDGDVVHVGEGDVGVALEASVGQHQHRGFAAVLVDRVDEQA
jgi:hypothetical protein